MKRTSLTPLSLCFALAGPLILSACGSGDNSVPPPSAMFYAYVASAGSSRGAVGAIYEYGVDSPTDVAPLSQASIAAGVYPATVIVNQGNVYVVNVGDGTISQYSIAADNTLVAMNPATVTNPGMHTLGPAPASAVINGSYFYVVNTADNTLSQFSIAENGQLTPLTPSTVATGVAPVAILSVVVPNTTTQYFYVLNSGAPGDTGTVSVFATSGGSGALTLVDSDTVTAGTNPSAITINNVFSTVDVMSTCTTAQCSGSIKEFSIGAAAALTDAGATVATGSDAVNMVVNDGGISSYAYVISNGAGADASAGALWQYEVQSTGELAPATPPTVTIGAAAIAQYINVNSLYVLTANAAGNGGNINFYSLGTGGLATLDGTSTINAPYPTAMGIHVLLDP